MPDRTFYLLVGMVVVATLAAVFSARCLIAGKTMEAPRVGGHADFSQRGMDRGEEGRLRRERFGKWEEERQAALELAGRMGEKQSLILSDRMRSEGEQGGFPSDLIKEAAGMKAVQLRVLVRELGRNPEIAGPNRAMLVTAVTDAWLKEHEAGRAEALREVLEIMSEVMPKLPRGFDTLPVSCAMGRSLEWDPAAWTDFMEAHWSRWSGANGNPNAEVMRRNLLRTLNDPELRMRVEKLPRAGSAN